MAGIAGAGPGQLLDVDDQLVKAGAALLLAARERGDAELDGHSFAARADELLLEPEAGEVPRGDLADATPEHGRLGAVDERREGRALELVARVAGEAGQGEVGALDAAVLADQRARGGQRAE